MFDFKHTLVLWSIDTTLSENVNRNLDDYPRGIPTYVCLQFVNKPFENLMYSDNSSP